MSDGFCNVWGAEVIIILAEVWFIERLADIVIDALVNVLIGVSADMFGVVITLVVTAVIDL